MKIALVYDRVNKWGGAERVLLDLHKIFPDALLFTSVYNPKTTSWADVFDVKTSFLQRFPFAMMHELYVMLMPLAFESFDFSGYDLVMSLTSEAAKGIIVKPPTKHICICLTPTRYLWSGYEEYFTNPLLRFLTVPLVWYLRLWDKIAAQRPDEYIAISEEVRRRIKKYYERDSEVVYPAVTLGDKKLKIKNKKDNDGKYFLVVSRLSRFTWYKRVDLAIAAASTLGLPLKVVGDGDIEYFKVMAGKSVDFLGKVSDDELVELYRSCRALIFPGIEDFGLVMVEAQSFGKPVIAYQGGGALEIVREGKTGEFFDRQNVDNLAASLKTFDEKKYNSSDCVRNAERFSFGNFEKEIRRVVKKVMP